MENKINIIEKRFPKFDLIYFEKNNLNSVYKNTDLVYSKSKSDFIYKIRNITKLRFNYISFWKESAKKEIIYLYDSIIENYLEIENEIKYMDEDFCFIIRKNDTNLNYLNEVDLEIELNRASEKNWSLIQKKFEELDYRMEKKFDILENVLRVRQFSLKFQLSQLSGI